MEGYDVLPIEDVVSKIDIFVTATGNKSIITLDHMRAMKDRAIVCNIGTLTMKSKSKDCTMKWHNVKPQSDEVEFLGGKRIILLAEGRLVNLGLYTDRYPSFVMSASFYQPNFGAN